MSTTIDSLQIEITQDSQQAVNGLDALTASLGRLKTASRGGVGLTAVSNQLKKLNDALNTMQNPSAKISQLVSALKPLESIGKSNLNSTLNSLKKLPEVTKQLAAIDMDAFATQINRVVSALKPLADEMNKVAAGFSAFPSRIQRLIRQNERLSTSNKRAGKSFGVMGTGISQLKVKLGVLYLALRRVANRMADWVVESNKYVENLNLFRITMRGASDEALEFANKVHDAFGIDPSEWIRFQAVFHNMATGFGIAADKATIMSKNLTQLGYDLATVFNVNYEVAMQKLQSALAGQPRPMREWGFDMSEATLKLAALRHGIEANVETMTQYEKSQIRYLQLMETAKRQGILGNFAREIHTPANAMRILNQQLQLFKRELGNMIIPLLMKILPYLQAFVKLLTDVSRTLALFFGFELPVIDYSGLGELPPLLDETEDGFEDAANAAKKFKNLLMGFDEINLLSKDTKSSVIGGGELEIDPSIYDYDFLGDISNKVNEIVDEIYRRVEPFVNFVRDNFDHIKDVVVAVGISLLSWQIGKGVLSFFQWLQGIGKGGKITLGLTLTLTGITLGAISIGNLVAGSDDVIDAIKAAIGSALALGGSLLAFGTGPLGWTIGVAAVLTMTIAGFIIGTKKRMDALIQEAISDNGGTLITDLSNAFSNLMEEIVRGYEPIIEGGEKLKTTSDAVEKAKNAFLVAFDALSAGSGTAEENIASITDSLTTLMDATQNLRKTAYNNITYALSTSLKDTAKAMGVDVANILLELDKLKSDTDRTMEDYKKRLEEINEQYRLSGDVQEYTKAVAELGDQFGASNPVLEEVDFNFRTMMTTLKGIDWEKEKDRAKAIEDIGKSSAKARAAVDDAFEGIVDSLSEYRKLATDPKAKVALDELLGVTTRAREEAYTRITGNLELLFGAMQTDLVTNIQNISDEFSQEWDNMEWWQKLGKSKPEYVAQAIERFRKDTMEPVSDGINEILADFGIEGGEEMQRAVDNILVEGFVHSINGAGPYISGFGKDISKLTMDEVAKMESLFGEKAKEMGIAIPIGTASGIDSKVEELKKTLESQNNTVTRMISTDPSFLKLLSTSRLAGLNVDSEMAEGLRDNLKLIKDEATGTVTEIENTITGEVTNVTPILVENLKALGVNLSEGLLAGTTEQLEKDKPWYVKAWTSIIDWFKNLFGINSPSTVFEGFGGNVMQGLLDGMSGWDNPFEKIFQGIVKNAIGILNDFIGWLNKAMNFSWDAVVVAGVQLVPAGSIQLVRIPTIPIPKYAEGGFPETGQLFIARESGAEMVGSIGSRTAVANNDQIVTAVSEGVYQAVSRAIGQKSGGTSGDVVLNINGSEFARIAIREINRYQRQAGETLLIV